MNVRIGAAAAALALVAGQSAGAQRAVNLPDPPQVRPVNGITSLTLTAVMWDQRSSMQYNGSRMLPTIRVLPGDRLRIAYANHLSAHSTEMCALGVCKDMTNLHFHGMEVSPERPQDDVLTMLAAPGQTLHYDVRFPANHLPGLYWIHTHPDGESAEQDLDGMSLAVVVDGIDRYVPEVRRMRERVMVIRTFDPPASEIEYLSELTDVPRKDCGTSEEEIEGFPSVNNAIRPQIAIAPGERQFWRIVNAQPNSYVNLQLDGSTFQVVELDGQPLAYRNPQRPIVPMSSVLLPPAGRVEAIVTGPPAGTHATLRTLCVNTGPAGDINAGGVLADVVPRASDEPIQTVPFSTRPAVYKPVNLSSVEQSAPQFVAHFTEGHHRFYINHRLFSMDAKPIVTVPVGTFQHWRVVNDTKEMHPFHIHQVHFLTYAINGRRISHPLWLDTMNTLPKGTIDVVLDATDPVIRGMSVFHCHILNHEDKGMMAKVLFK